VKLYCWHNWDIDFVCEVGQTAKCKRCGANWSGKRGTFPSYATNPTVIAVSEDELPKEAN